MLRAVWFGFTQELERLEPDAGVFKLVGPVLIRQDLVEARANVTKRLEYISGERRVLRARSGGVRALGLREARRRVRVGAGSGLCASDAAAARAASGWARS